MTAMTARKPNATNPRAGSRLKSRFNSWSALSRGSGTPVSTPPQASDVDIVSQVKGLILHKIGSPSCSIECVAEQLGVHKRTLHRRLSVAGTSFRALHATVREEVAVRRVVVGSESLGAIAAQLGFSELSAFSRWYRSQFGQPPREARERASTRNRITRSIRDLEDGLVWLVDAVDAMFCLSESYACT